LVPFYGMAKNSSEGNQSRKKRYYEALAARSIRPVQVLAPESAHPLLRQAARLMIRDDEPMDPRAALRQIGGANEPGELDTAPELRSELEAAKARITQIEREAETREQALQAERDAARAAEAAEREKAQATAAKAQKAVRAAEKALGRAEKAERAIEQARNLPGLKGRLVRWLAGDVLE
jgi:hypothetical protein